MSYVWNLMWPVYKFTSVQNQHLFCCLVFTAPCSIFCHTDTVYSLDCYPNNRQAGGPHHIWLSAFQFQRKQNSASALFSFYKVFTKNKLRNFHLSYQMRSILWLLDGWIIFRMKRYEIYKKGETYFLTAQLCMQCTTKQNNVIKSSRNIKHNTKTS